MDKLFEQFHFAHRKALVNYRNTHGPSTPAFWKLGELKVEPFDDEVLRIRLRDAILKGTFRDIHVPAFFTFVQRQAVGHSHWLWRDTVIPLLAGEGVERNELMKRLEQSFAGEYPFHSALRTWLNDQRRDLYRQDSPHFWFVRATIGECALAWISKDFTEEYLNSLVRVSHRDGDMQELLKDRFRQQITSPRWSCRSKDEILSIRTLEDCLVEAGTIVMRVFKYLANHRPPAEGWELNALILEVQGNNPTALPPLVRNFIRNRLQSEIGNVTLDQLLALLRANPGCRLDTPTGTWDLTNLDPPPVCHAVLYRGNQQLGSFELTDDLGRRAEDLQDLPPAERWETSGQFVWRLDRHRFEVRHPSRLRSQARVVLPIGNAASTSLWVLTLPYDEFYAHDAPAGKTPTRFLLRAWPTLDEQFIPAFRVGSFHLPVGWNGEVKLVVSSELHDDGQTVWQGQARRGEVRVNRTVSARPGKKTLFRLECTVKGIAERQMAYSWHLPSLFVGGRRLPPGRHLVPTGGLFSLVCKEEPSLQGTAAPAKRASLGNGISRWDFSAGSGPRLVVELAEQRWELEYRVPLTLRAWLELAPSTEPRPNWSRYRLTEDGIDLFFQHCPWLILAPIGPTLPAEEMHSLLEQMRLVAGNQDDLDGRVEYPLNDLIQNSGTGPFRINLDALLPPALVEPGLDVRWLHLENGSASGQDLRFLLLPYDREVLQPSGPGQPGTISLEDSSSTWKSLDLQPVGDPRLPHAGMISWPLLPVRSEVPFLDYQIHGCVDLPLCGMWFQMELWTLPDLERFLKDQQLGCGLAIVPAGESLHFQVESADGSVLASSQLTGQCSREVTFAEVFPSALLENSDLQSRWLAHPRSCLVCRQGSLVRGRVDIDLRGLVTSLEEINRQGPDLLGTTRITLAIGYRQGPMDDLNLLLVRTDREPAAVVMTRHLMLRGEMFLLNHWQEELTLPDPGYYKVYLQRSGETDVVACHDLHATAPEATTDLTLEAFLDVFPESPTLDQVIRLFRFLQGNRQVLQGEYAPWNQFRFYSRMDESWNQTTGTVQELLGLLRAFGDKPGDESFAKIAPVDPDNIPPEIFLEVATVVLHLQWYTAPHARPFLPDWEVMLDRVRRKDGLPPDRRRWAEILHRACHGLQSPVVRQSPLDPVQVAGVSPWFPCQDSFLEFLASDKTNRTPTTIL